MDRAGGEPCWKLDQLMVDQFKPAMSMNLTCLENPLDQALGRLGVQ